MDCTPLESRLWSSLNFRHTKAVSEGSARRALQEVRMCKLFLTLIGWFQTCCRGSVLLPRLHVS